MKLIGYINVLRKFKKFGKSVSLFCSCKQRSLINNGINNISVVVLTNYHRILSCYRPQTKFGVRQYFYKRLSFCPGGHAWLGGMHSWGRGWEVACAAWGMCGRSMHSQGACVAGGVHDGGCMVEACIVGGCVAGEGVCVAGGMHGRRDGHCSGRYTSYWNAFLWSMKRR